MSTIKDKFSSLKSKIAVAASGIAVALGIGVERSSVRLIPDFFKPESPDIVDVRLKPKENEDFFREEKNSDVIYGRINNSTLEPTYSVADIKIKAEIFKEFETSNQKITELKIRIENLSKQNNNSELLAKYKEELKIETKKNIESGSEFFKDLDIKKAQENLSMMIESMSSKRPTTILEVTIDGFDINGKPVSEAEIKSLIKLNPNVVIKGKLTEQHISKLREMGIDMVFDNNIYPLVTEETKYQFIFIAPKEDVQISKIFSQSKNISRSSLVRSKEDLIAKIENAKQNDRTPILIFNNKNNLLFDELVSKYGVYDIITCNSYAIENGNFSMITTNYVNASNVVKALRKIPDETMFKDNLYMEFSKNYYELQHLTSYKQGIMYVGCGIGVGGVVVTIVFINKK